MSERPKVKSESQKELDKVEKQFETYSDQIKDLTQDRLSSSPKSEYEPQTKLSQEEISKSKDIYLKPEKMIGSKEKFNERFREDYNFAKEYVQFIAENKEIIGESIEIWTKPFPGCPAEYYRIPVNKPVWGPRYLAEQISKCSYHRLRSEEDKLVSSDGRATYTGSMVIDQTIQRLNAVPVSSRKSVFMGAKAFG